MILSDYPEGDDYFLQEVLKRITKEQPEHRFIFIFDRPYDKKIVFDRNVIPVVAGPSARHPLLLKWWYDIKIPAVLKKYKANVFVSCEGLCSLRTKIPQCIVIRDLSFLHYPSFIKRSCVYFFTKYTPRFLQKANNVATVSEFLKNDILSHYQIKEDKINVVYNAVKEVFQPLNENEKVGTRKKYTDEKNYFIYTGAIHPRKNLEALLKAFSIFKKRQKSNWRLVITGRLARKNDPFLEKLKTYKYREDVILTGYVKEEELVQLIGAAYAMVYPSLREGFGIPPLEALNCGVPVITSSDSSMEEICGEAALYADVTNHSDIADKMMLLYKNEDMRRQLIEKGKLVTKKYSFERSAGLLWQSIEKALA